MNLLEAVWVRRSQRTYLPRPLEEAQREQLGKALAECSRRGSPPAPAGPDRPPGHRSRPPSRSPGPWPLPAPARRRRPGPALWGRVLRPGGSGHRQAPLPAGGPRRLGPPPPAGPQAHGRGGEDQLLSPVAALLLQIRILRRTGQQEILPGPLQTPLARKGRDPGTRRVLRPGGSGHRQAPLPAGGPRRRVDLGRRRGVPQGGGGEVLRRGDLGPAARRRCRRQTRPARSPPAGPAPRRAAGAGGQDFPRERPPPSGSSWARPWRSAAAAPDCISGWCVPGSRPLRARGV